MTDSELRTAIQKELDWEPSIQSDGIGVAVREGITTLSGYVRSYPEKHEAELVAGRIRGVRAVVANLEVRLPDVNVRNDEEIARAAANAIAWNTLLPPDSVKVWVENGRITLEGNVTWQYQRQSASASVRYLTGVKEVNNHITVGPVVRREAVKAEIEEALLRNAEFDAHRIHIEVHGDRLVLSGEVRSWAERQEAERAAWGSPGVKQVDNHITVNAGELVTF